LFKNNLDLSEQSELDGEALPIFTDGSINENLLKIENMHFNCPIKNLTIAVFCNNFKCEKSWGKLAFLWTSVYF